MSALRNMESAISGVVNRVFGRVFRGHVELVELARKLGREMEDHKTVSVSRIYVPNEYVIYLSPSDRAHYSSFERSAIRELAEYLTQRARHDGFTLLSEPAVLFSTDRDLKAGEYGIACRMVDPPEVEADADAAQDGAPAAPPLQSVPFAPYEPPADLLEEDAADGDDAALLEATDRDLADPLPQDVEADPGSDDAAPAAGDADDAVPEPDPVAPSDDPGSGDPFQDHFRPDSAVAPDDAPADEASPAHAEPQQDADPAPVATPAAAGADDVPGVSAPPIDDVRPDAPVAPPIPPPPAAPRRPVVPPASYGPRPPDPVVRAPRPAPVTPPIPPAHTNEGLAGVSGTQMMPPAQRNDDDFVQEEVSLIIDGRRHRLSKRTTTIGRSRDCDIAIADANASRQHAEIRHIGLDYFLVDQGSTNGTYVNRQRIRRHALADGDRIVIGTTEMIVEHLKVSRP